MIVDRVVVKIILIKLSLDDKTLFKILRIKTFKSIKGLIKTNALNDLRFETFRFTPVQTNDTGIFL